MKIKILLLTILLCFISCAEDHKVTNVKRIVKEWVGKTIKLPEIEPFYLVDKNSLPDIYLSRSKEYKILFYVDSTGCITCKLHLHLWKVYIKELYEKAEFLFYFYPKTEETLLREIRFAELNYPVYIDRNNELYRINKLPDNPQYQCFLLDKDNKVVSIGNPVKNPKIWDLYKKIITGKVSDKPSVTVAEAEQSEIKLTDLQAGKTSETVFSVRNTGAQPLVIRMVESSCSCTVPEWEKQPVASGKSTEIKVRITPENQEFFSKVITVHCNTESEQILLKISGNVE